jgi:hypothetical protein
LARTHHHHDRPRLRRAYRATPPPAWCQLGSASGSALLHRTEPVATSIPPVSREGLPVDSPVKTGEWLRGDAIRRQGFW